MSKDAESPVTKLVDNLFRWQAGQMISTLTRIFGSQHLNLAEEVVQDAMIKALQQWPFHGIPENPAAWLIQVAKNRALDLLRREKFLHTKAAEIVSAFAIQEKVARQQYDPSILKELLDDELNMIFIACHPTLSRETRVALTLKTVGGFGIGEIARAFLCKDATVAQRLVRAKRQIIDEHLSFELPSLTDLPPRLDSVLEVIYLLFNEGYAAHQGDSLIRYDLCNEAIRLGKLIVEHPVTNLPKCHALLSLMLMQVARLPARVNEDGDLFLLSLQDRSLWDRKLIYLGLTHLDMCSEGDELTEYHLQAGIAAVHATAPSYQETDWKRIIELYAQLIELNPSPIFALNQAVAIAKVYGAKPAIDAIGEIPHYHSLDSYYLLYATLAELWKELGEYDKAIECYQRALNQNCSAPEQRFLQKRLSAIIANESLNQ